MLSALTGTLVNTVAVLVGGGIGLLLKKGLPQKLADTLMKGLALCTLFIGVSGILENKNTLVLILSMVFGALLGEAVDLDDKILRLGQAIEVRFRKPGAVGPSLSDGFVTATLLFCVGALAIVGALQSGLTGNHEMIYNKSMLDFVAAMIFASSLGAGVLLSAVSVLLYQSVITLLAQLIAPLLSDDVIGEMTATGSLLLIGLALNMLGLTKLKIMNYVPAIFLPILLCLFL